MKQSYFTTPRRSEDCTFHSWADPIHRDEVPPAVDPDRIVMAGCVVVFCIIAALGFTGVL